MERKNRDIGKKVDEVGKEVHGKKRSTRRELTEACIGQTYWKVQERKEIQRM